MVHPCRLMTQDDLSAVVCVQAECYPAAMQEAESTLRERLRLAPDSAWVAEDDGGVCAYLVGYRSRLGKVTPLGALFDVAESADTLYLHDLAVSNRCKGRGIGTALVRRAGQKAADEGLAYSALVSVQGSRGFWERLGYLVWDGLEPVQLAHLKTYPGPSWYMVRNLK